MVSYFIYYFLKNLQIIILFIFIIIIDLLLYNIIFDLINLTSNQFKMY